MYSLYRVYRTADLYTGFRYTPLLDGVTPSLPALLSAVRNYFRLRLLTSCWSGIRFFSEISLRDTNEAQVNLVTKLALHFEIYQINNFWKTILASNDARLTKSCHRCDSS